MQPPGDAAGAAGEAVIGSPPHPPPTLEIGASSGTVCRLPETKPALSRPLRRRLLAAALLIPAAACGPRADPDAILVSGYVEAVDVRVSTKVGGILEDLTVLEGDRVEAGQILARLDSTDLELALAAAAAARTEDEAELRLLLAGARREEIAEARALVARAEADLLGARQDLDRLAQLAGSGLEAQEKLDGAQVRHDMAQSALAAARERLRKLEAGSRQEEIDAARAAVAAAEARMAQLEQQIADATIASPVAGIVTEKLSEAGELALPGSGIAIVTHLAEPWLNVFVAEPDLARIRIGQQAEVTTDDGQSRTGRVIFIASQAEFTPKNVQTRDERVKLVYKVKIGLDNEDGMFKPGMPAEARLQPAAATE